jgi:16S rRNA (guanine527-N7)-methyltransferase
VSAEIGGIHVSRETFERLEHYLALLNKWNPRINLVSPTTLAEAWTRHFIDSAQIFNLAEGVSDNWVDMGTGGGFPGMVIAIISAELQSNRQITMIESDQRKCAFLRNVARETGVGVQVLSKRIDQVEPQNAGVVSARALASLPQLLGFAGRHMATDGIALFPKGRSWREEIAEARLSYSFQHEAIESKTNPEAVVLRIGEIEHV